MKKTSKVLLIILLSLVFLVAAFFGYCEIVGNSYSISAFLAKRKTDNFISALVEKDVKILCTYNSEVDCEEKLTESLRSLEDIGIKVVSGKSILNTFYKENSIVYGEVELNLEVNKTNYWYKDEHDNWSAIAELDPLLPNVFESLDKANYTISFKLSLNNNVLSLDDVLKVINTTDNRELQYQQIRLIHGIQLIKGNINNTITISANSPEFLNKAADRIVSGFDQIAKKKYDDACNTFGYSAKKSKQSFKYGMDYLIYTSIKIINAEVDKTTINGTEKDFQVTVKLYVNQSGTGNDFGYVQKYPKGIYSMDFLMQIKDEKYTIIDFIFKEGENKKPGLQTIYMPDTNTSSLTIYYLEDGEPIYDSQALFMVELWDILQSYNLTSKYAIFWGFGS